MKKAFTLIELLIVVAIIAILAAIAVPNFLEAQTRAKVSRALSDQRSYATAIETYMIDYSTYPLHTPWETGALGTAPTDTGDNINFAMADSAQQDTEPWDTVASFALHNDESFALGITTPLSYMSTYSPDVFAQGFQQATFAYAAGQGKFLLWSPGPDGAYQLSGQESISDASNSAAQYIVGGTQSMPSSYLIAGPLSTDKPHDSAPADGPAFTYDSTNGTTSEGDVYRTK